MKRNKHVFFQSLSSTPPKKFWSFVYSTRKRLSVPALLSKGNIFSSSSDKAEILKQFFSECFNSCSPPIVSYLFASLSCLSPCPPDFLCTESEVLGLISRLLLPQSLVQIWSLLKCLNLHVYSLLLPSLTCSTSLSQGRVPADWKTSLLFPSPSVHLTWTIPLITKPFPYSLSLAGYLKTSSLYPLQILSQAQPYLHYSIWLSSPSVHFISPSLLHRSTSSAFSSPSVHFISPSLLHRSTSSAFSSPSVHFISPSLLHRSTTPSALLFASHSFHSLLPTNKSAGPHFLDLKKAFDSVPHKQSFSSHSTGNHLRHQLVTSTCDFWSPSGFNNRSSPLYPPL